jgi:hypothetical protein
MKIRKTETKQSCLNEIETEMEMEMEMEMDL